MGVIVDQSLSGSSQCAVAVKKVNRMLGYITRSIEYKSKEVILTLDNTLVRPDLEYCVQFWGLHYNKDIEVLEKVQRRTTRLMSSIKVGEMAREVRAVVWQSEGCRFDPTLGVSKCP